MSPTPRAIPDPLALAGAESAAGFAAGFAVALAAGFAAGFAVALAAGSAPPAPTVDLPAW